MKASLVPFQTNLRALARKSKKVTSRQHLTTPALRDRPLPSRSASSNRDFEIRRGFPNRGEERCRVENGRSKMSSLMGNGNRVCVQAVRRVISNYHAVVKAVRRWLAAN